MLTSEIPEVRPLSSDEELAEVDPKLKKRFEEYAFISVRVNNATTVYAAENNKMSEELEAELRSAHSARSELRVETVRQRALQGGFAMTELRARLCFVLIAILALINPVNSNRIPSGPNW